MEIIKWKKKYYLAFFMKFPVHGSRKRANLNYKAVYYRVRENLRERPKSWVVVG